MRSFPTRTGTVDRENLVKTFKYVFLGVLAASLCAGLGVMAFPTMAPGAWWGLVILEFALLFAFMFFKNLPTYLGFTAVTGLTLVPMLSAYLGQGMGHLIAYAFCGTTAITGGTTLFAMKTKKDFTSLLPYLFWILVGMIVLMIANIFLGLPWLGTAISAAAVGVFSIWMVVDVQRALSHNVPPLQAAMDIYLNILNIFVHLLKLLGDLED